MKQRFCRSCGKWHEPEAWPIACVSVSQQASSPTLSIPYFISDTTDPIQHPLDQKFYTSKSTFERITKEGGYETVGNDPARLRPPVKPKADPVAIKQSVEKAMARFNAGERV